MPWSRTRVAIQSRILVCRDFEVLQDGKRQQILSVSYVNTEDPRSSCQSSGFQTARQKQIRRCLPPATRVRPANAGRILTFVVDDGSCSASRVGMLATQEALQKFVTEQMRPDDLVAIYQTRSGSSMLQQYTSDKAQLLRVAKKVRWYPSRGTCANDGGRRFLRSCAGNGGH